MPLSPDCPVPADYAGKYDTVQEIFRRELPNTWVSRLECVLAQFGYAVERGQVRLDPGDIQHRFTMELLSKLVNEGYGLAGCLYNGAFLAAHHHARSSLELAAAYHHVFANRNKRQKKLSKFYEFKELDMFNMYQRLRRDDEAGRADRQILGTIEPERVAGWEARVSQWCELFSIKLDDAPEDLPDEERLASQKRALEKVGSWHHPATITGLFLELSQSRDAEGQIRDPESSLRGVYDVLCHATHFSPQTRNLAQGLNLIGLPLAGPGELDHRTINRLVGSALLGIERTIKFVEEFIGVNFAIDFADLDIDAP